MKVFSGVQEALILGLMLVTVLALFYADIAFEYKIAIGAVAFVIIFLATLAASILQQQREMIKKQA